MILTYQYKKTRANIYEMVTSNVESYTISIHVDQGKI